MLAVVEDDQSLKSFQRLRECIDCTQTRLDFCAERRGDCIYHQAGSAQRRQINKPHAVRKILQFIRAYLDREPRFPAPTGADQCDDAMLVDQRPHPFLLPNASDEGGQLDRQILPETGKRFEWRKVKAQLRMRKLKDVLQLRKIAQTMASQLNERRTVR